MCPERVTRARLRAVVVTVVATAVAVAGAGCGGADRSTEVGPAAQVGNGGSVSGAPSTPASTASPSAVPVPAVPAASGDALPSRPPAYWTDPSHVAYAVPDAALPSPAELPVHAPVSFDSGGTTLLPTGVVAVCAEGAEAADRYAVAGRSVSWSPNTDDPGAEGVELVVRGFAADGAVLAVADVRRLLASCGSDGPWRVVAQPAGGLVAVHPRGTDAPGLARVVAVGTVGRLSVAVRVDRRASDEVTVAEARRLLDVVRRRLVAAGVVATADRAAGVR